MKTLKINDLPMTEELSAETMSAVRGGHSLYYTPYMWGGYDFSEKNASFSALQQINQGQSLATNVGNNVAVLGGAASPFVPVTATQNANIQNNVNF